MENKNIILGGVAVAGLAFYLSSQNKKPQAPLVINQGTPTDSTFDPDKGMINGITSESRPNVIEWKRPQWAQYYKEVYLNEGPQIAANKVWQYWNVENNPFRSFYPHANKLILNLATYRPEISVNNTGTISADDQPIYRTWSNAWSGLSPWDCNTWQLWYDLNKDKYGYQTAKNKFLNAWRNPDNALQYYSLTQSGAAIECGYNCDFINYFRTNGIDIAQHGAETGCTLVQIPSNLLDATANVTQGVSNTAALLSFVMPVAVVGGIGLYLYKQYKE